MEKTYKYRFSRRAIYWTLVYLVVFVLLAGCCTTSTKEATSRPGSPRSSWRSSP